MALLGPDIPLTLAQLIAGDRGDHVDEDLHGTGTVDVVIDGIDGLFGRHAVEVFELADRCLDLGGCGDRFRDRRGHFHRGAASPKPA